MFRTGHLCSLFAIVFAGLLSALVHSAFGQQTGSASTDYGEVAAQIIAAGQNSNDSFIKLQELCDDIGHRLSGSASLDQAIDWAQASMKADGQENVRAEKVMVTKWVRGNESCELVEPRPLKFAMLGLGGSIGTPPAGITAEVIVVANKEELDSLPAGSVEGKILVFNCVMPRFAESTGSGYGATVQYRSNGAKWASEKGAVAVLVRSITANSLQTPHTGAMRYGTSETRIPAAAITIEAAEMLGRLQARGKKTAISLKMEAETTGEAPSANVLAEIVGSEKPEELVVIGGHIDSWDVGQGAHDDGTGCVAAMEALNILRKLNLRPRRTIRVVLWTNEENGVAGGQDYVGRHQNEVHVAGIESDSGGFAPSGIDVEMLDDRKEDLAAEQLSEILKHLHPINATVGKKGHSGVDVGLLKALGTPCLGLRVDGSRYFDTHHTWADTVDKVDPQELTNCAITLAVSAYILADMPGRLGEK